MNPLSLIVCSALVATSAMAQQAAKSGVDYATLPQEPAEAEQQLSAASVTLAKAMEAATAFVNGTVVSARAIPVGDSVSYEILCNSNGITKRVLVDGKTGAVSGAAVTLESALGSALKAHDGVVKSVEADFLADPPVINVFLYQSGKSFSVSINATTGETISDTEIPWLPGAPFTGEIHTSDSGLKYIELVEGTGAAPSSASSMVKVHYTGYLVDGTKFDSSVDRGQPTDFPLDRVVKGWGEGVGSMKVGGKRKLIIPSDLGYGPRGGGPIPPDATLIFDVELLEVDVAAAAPKAPQATRPAGNAGGSGNAAGSNPAASPK